MDIIPEDDYRVIYAADTLVAAEKFKRDEDLMEKVDKELKSRQGLLKSAMAEKFPESKEKPTPKKTTTKVAKKEVKKTSKPSPKASKKSK